MASKQTTSKKDKSAKRRALGRFIVADPEICHGKPTFHGTRIMVTQVLQQIARGMNLKTIITEWRGKISKEAIAEAVELANQALMDHANEYEKESLQV